MVIPRRDVELERGLRARGLRVTAPRTSVWQVLSAHPHATADTVAIGVREHLGSVSTQAVYDVLRVFTEAGLVRRIIPAGSAARYELQSDDNHHHLVCRSCGTVVDVDCATGSAPCLKPSEQPAGFAIDEAEVVFWGYCQSCQTSESSHQ